MKKSIEKKSSKKIVVEKIVLMLDIGGNLVIFPMEKKQMREITAWQHVMFRFQRHEHVSTLSTLLHTQLLQCLYLTSFSIRIITIVFEWKSN